MSLPVYVPKAPQEYRSNITAYLTSRSSRLTNFKPGSRIRTLAEAVALELGAADSDYDEFWKYAVQEACYRSFGFDLKDGTVASGQVRVEHTGHGSPFIIPQFTITLFGLTFTSEATPPSIPIGQTFALVNVTADESGTESNIDAESIDTQLGQGDIEPDFAVAFDRIYNPSAFSGGTDQETEESRETRFQDFVNNLARSTLLGIRAGVLNVSGVVAASIQENINPFSLTFEPGWVVASISDGTASPPGSLLTEVKKVIDGDPNDIVNYPGLRAAGIQSHVQAIDILAVNMTIDISVIDVTTLTDPEIETLVFTAIADYVNRLQAGQDVLLQQVEAVGLFANRADLIAVTVTSPGADIVVSGSELPKIGGTGGGTLTLGTISRIAFP